MLPPFTSHQLEFFNSFFNSPLVRNTIKMKFESYDFKFSDKKYDDKKLVLFACDPIIKIGVFRIGDLFFIIVSDKNTSTINIVNFTLNHTMVKNYFIDWNIKFTFYSDVNRFQDIENYN